MAAFTPQLDAGPTLDELVAITAASPDDELLFRQSELLDVLDAAEYEVATRWLAEIIEASSHLTGNLHQRFVDGRVRALGLLPRAKREYLVKLYVRAIDHVAAPLRECELRLMRRAIRLLPRDVQHSLEYHLPRGRET